MPEPKFDDRTEKNLGTLLPAAQDQARQFMARLRSAGISARIISGTRTYDEQDSLYAQGRTKPGPKVTNARGGFSNHNFGIAWDIGIFDGNEYVGESHIYDKAGEIGRSMGLEWGGDWKNIVDKPHFQCKTGKTLAQLRQLHGEGQTIPIKPLSNQPDESSADTPSAIKIVVNGEVVNVPALLIKDRTWVGVRAFVGALGGGLDAAVGAPFRVTVSLSGVSKECSGQIIDDIGYARFADLNALYKLDFKFDPVNRTLLITK